MDGIYDAPDGKMQTYQNGEKISDKIVKLSEQTELKTGSAKTYFQPGNKAALGRGRPRKETETAYMKAINDALPPHKLALLILELLDTPGWRAKAFAVELALHYTIGKPVQRIETQSSGLQEIIAILSNER
jgi:hypothetical protein